MMKTLPNSKLLVLITALFITGFAQAANWFVKGDPNTNTTGGTTWATAVTLTKAASVAGAGDVIYLAAGTYTQTASITFGKAFTVIGGFAGTENESTITPSMSNPTTNVVTFTQANPSTFRIFAIGSSTLTGVVSLQGVAFNGLNNSQNGLAIECSSSSTLTTSIKNCTFKNFTATGTTVAGAININNTTANDSVINCSFENITSGNNGGAISTNTKAGYTIVISGCTFKNTATPTVSTVYNGGAIYANATAYTLNIDNCTFNGTKASTGGAIYTAALVTVNISNSTFQNCTTVHPTVGSGHGGAIIFQAPTMNILNCKFTGCSDNGRGLIYWNAASTTANIKKCIFTNNTSQSTTQNSGAVFGIQNGSSTVTIDSCYAYNNTSTANTSSMSASVLYSATGSSNITVKNSVFVGNVGSAPLTRAVIYATGATSADNVTLLNTIVSNNTNTNTVLKDTLRDVSSFSKTYGTISYTNVIVNGEYRASGSNTTSPYFKVNYPDLLTTADMATLTTPTDIVSIITASTPLLAKYNIPTQLSTVAGTSSVFAANGSLRFAFPAENVNVYNVQGRKIKTLALAQEVSLSDLPQGVYLVNYSHDGKSSVYKFIK